jgi:anti-sigma B factor antagonist
MNFSVASESLGETSVAIAVGGEVDLYTAPRLKEELLRAIDSGATLVLIDLTTTTFIDSTTLGVLVSGLRRLRPNGGELALVVTDRSIRKIFEITGLDRVFPIHETRAAALESLAVGA